MDRVPQKFLGCGLPSAMAGLTCALVVCGLEQAHLHAAGAAEVRGAERGPGAVQAGAARDDSEKIGNLRGENAVALEAPAPGADVELAAAQLAQAAEYTVLFCRHMGFEPVEKHLL